MPDRIALCLEDVTASHATRYVRCVALRGRQPGLGIDDRGAIAWQSGGRLACELWVSADDQLILLRPEGAPAVRVERAGRSVDAPYGKPVVLLDQDTFQTAGRRFRVHVHGAATSAHAPSPLADRHVAARLAATVAIGVAALGCNRSDSARPPVEVRETPPIVPPPQDPVLDASVPQAPDTSDASAPDAADGAQAGDAGRDAAKRGAAPAKPPIQIRNHPPDPVE
jgi:hypothetical protein